MIFVGIVVWFFISGALLLLVGAAVQVLLESLGIDNVVVVLFFLIVLLVLWAWGFGIGLQEIKLYFGKG